MHVFDVMLSVGRQSRGKTPWDFPLVHRGCKAKHMGFKSPACKPASTRAPTDEELAQIPWLLSLSVDERSFAVDRLVVHEIQTGDFICRFGKAVTHWYGLVDGLLKMSNDDSQGFAITFTGLAPGGWFGEGTVLKREHYRYNVQALRTCRIAGLPVQAFYTLQAESIGFNRFITLQLNERLGQFIAAREFDRINDPNLRVARHLAALFHPLLSPNVGGELRITQQELAYLVGLSRQRVNEALAFLADKGWIRIEYGGLRVLDLAALRHQGV